MSAGHVHTRACVILAAGFSVGILASQNIADFQYVAGALTGIMLSPDLDVDAKNLSYTYIRKRLGRLPELAWTWLWHFYRKSIKHGSELSHFPVISTLGRLAYLFLFLVLLPSIVIHANYLPSVQAEVIWWFGKVCQYWRFILALMGADIIHWGLDIMTTEHKNGTRVAVHRVSRKIRTT
jgi:uncharacterized metal-binding protein